MMEADKSKVVSQIHIKTAKISKECSENKDGTVEFDVDCGGLVSLHLQGESRDAFDSWSKAIKDG